MNPIDVFLIPGRYALELILAFFQVAPHAMESELATVFAFCLAMILWSWVLRVCIAIVQRQFGFAPRR